MRRILVCVILVAVSTAAMFPLTCKSQNPQTDTTFIASFDTSLTVRAFISQKYTLFALEAPDGTPQLQYRPNTRLNAGVGATYRSLTLNLAYGFGFLNNDADRGKTRYLDLQSHVYGRRVLVDLFGQFYKGYYLYPRGVATGNPHTFYQRPDLKVTEIGVNAYAILNHRKFSYRAAFLQNEWQKKSAGTFLAGAGFVYGLTRADSSFVPAQLRQSYPQREVRYLRYFEIGPGIAYAYTLVWQQHFFVTASATLSLDVGLVGERTSASRSSVVRFSPNFLFRSVAGYNGAVWSINVSWFTSRTAIKGNFSNGDYHVTTGNYRFTVVKRFTPHGGLKKVLTAIDRWMD